MKHRDVRRIEYMPLGKIRAAARNPKEHADRQISDSVGRFGFVEPMVLDDRTGQLVAGHGRRDALLALKKAGGAPPGGVKLARGEWLVPVIRGWRSKNKAEAEAYLIASNRLVEAGGWDNAELERMLAQLARDGGAEAMVGLDITPGYIEALLRESDTGAADLVPDPPAESWVKFGDLFALGEHRLLCGDSTNRIQVSALMGKERAALMNTDPPYGVAYDNSDRGNAPASKGAIANDELQNEKLQAFLELAFGAAKECALGTSAAWYLWHAMLSQGFFAAAAAAAAANVVLHRQIIWVKPSLLLGRGQYHWRHELCFFGWVDGHQPPDFGRGNGERDQTTVWEFPGVGVAERETFGHATPKPVALFEIPITKHTLPGDVVFEPFAGSGPQFIAAQRLGRRCFGIELEPRFCQVIIDRWERFTGLKHEKIS